MGSKEEEKIMEWDVQVSSEDIDE